MSTRKKYRPLPNDNRVETRISTKRETWKTSEFKEDEIEGSKSSDDELPISDGDHSSD